MKTQKLIFLLLFFSSCWLFVPVEDLAPTEDYFVRVQDWEDVNGLDYWVTDTDSTRYGVPLELITFSTDTTITYSHKFFWSDEVKKMTFPKSGQFYWGAHWLEPYPWNGLGNAVIIRIYRDSLLTDEVLDLITALYPQDTSQITIASYEGRKFYQL